MTNPAPDALNSASVLIGTNQREDFQKKLAALNRKAEKFGLPPVVASEPTQEVYVRTVKMLETRNGEGVETTLTAYNGQPLDTSSKSLVEMLRIKLTYPDLKLGNWSVVGKIEQLEEGNGLYSLTTNEQDAAELMKHAHGEIGCEHCETHRARKQAFLLKNPEGDYKEVGSTCIEDFTGHDPAVTLFLAQMYSFHNSPNWDAEERQKHSAPLLITEEYLADVIFASKYMGGFVSSSKAKETGDMATYVIADKLATKIGQSQNETLLDTYRDTREAMLDEARRVIDWAETRPVETLFDSNIKNMLSASVLRYDPKSMAFSAAATAMYAREAQQKLERENSVPSEHVGAVGQRLHGALMHVRSFSSDTQYGTMYRHNFVDEKGNKYSWRTSNGIGDMGNGEIFTADFKIKEHTEFRDELITEVSHLKFKEWGNVIDQLPEPGEKGPKKKAEKIPGMVISYTDLETAAFTDIGRAQQIALTLQLAADEFKNPNNSKPHEWPASVWSGKDKIPLRDVNDQIIAVMSLHMESSIGITRLAGPDRIVISGIRGQDKEAFINDSVEALQQVIDHLMASAKQGLPDKYAVRFDHAGNAGKASFVMGIVAPPVKTLDARTEMTADANQFDPSDPGWQQWARIN